MAGNPQLRLKDIFDQLNRYGSPDSERIFEALEALTDVNDDITNARAKSVVLESVDKVKAALDALVAEYDWG